MRAVELDVDGVDTVLPGDESDSVLVSFQLSDDTLLQSSRGAVDFGRHLALCAIETHRKGCWVIDLQTRLPKAGNSEAAGVVRRSDHRDEVRAVGNVLVVELH